MMRETRGKKLGTLRCHGCKPSVIRGHAAAFKYWFNAFGHTGPYSQYIEVVVGIQKIIPKGNPMECPSNIMFYHSNDLNDLAFFTQYYFQIAFWKLWNSTKLPFFTEVDTSTHEQNLTISKSLSYGNGHKQTINFKFICRLYCGLIAIY